MHNPTKSDPALGWEIHKHLLELGIETPMHPEVTSASDGVHADKSKVEALTELNRQMMEILGLDLSNDSLEETPARIAKMLVYENFWGLDPAKFPKCTTVSNEGVGYDEMLVENNIAVISQCEHHFVVIDGFATIAYIPHKRVVGLSKLNRIVEYFCKRPQIQERLTAQIHAAVSFITGTPDVAVLIQATHYCVKSRGVRDENSFTTTSRLTGSFRDPNQKAREEFLALARNMKH